MKKEYFFVANWKMQLTTTEEVKFANLNKKSFEKLSQNKKSKIILCSSFLSISSLCKIFENTKIKIGAQNCSNHQEGAYTSQISAKSLKSLNCEFCIIGHSECREEYKETNADIVQKFKNLIQEKISPIICIGENLEENQKNQTIDILNKELKQIFEFIKSNLVNLQNLPILIAYEPIWAIGSDKIPAIKDLNQIFIWLKEQTNKISGINFKLIYGGSVNSKNILELKQINHLEGFLVGGSSLDFQEFEKVVKL